MSKGEISLGSPRNITVNTLNGNQFFTLDYQNNESLSKTSFFGKYDSQRKIKHKNQSNNLKFPIKNSTRTAPISRSTQIKLHQPYARIKRVNEIIKQKKMIEEQEKSIPQKTDKIKFPPSVPRTSKSINEKYQSFLVGYLDRITPPKKQRNPINSFQQNYKKKKKLTEKVRKKSSVNMSPISLNEKERNLTPVDHRFFISHLKEKSVEGNKIKFEVNDKIKKRYY